MHFLKDISELFLRKSSCLLIDSPRFNCLNPQSPLTKVILNWLMKLSHRKFTLITIQHPYGTWPRRGISKNSPLKHAFFETILHWNSQLNWRHDSETLSLFIVASSKMWRCSYKKIFPLLRSTHKMICLKHNPTSEKYTRTSICCDLT